MTRIDRIVVGRLASSIGLTFAVLYGIVVLAGVVEVRHVTRLIDQGGIGFAALTIATVAAQTVLTGFTVVVLLGAIAGLLSLQASRELTVIKASGRSVWRLMLAPAAITFVLGVVIAAGINGLLLRIDRDVLTAPAQDQSLWLAGTTGETRYFLEADSAAPDGRGLTGVAVFMQDKARTRIEAPSATLAAGEWQMPQATILAANAAPEQRSDYRLPTSLGPAAVRAQLQSLDNLTLFELGSALASGGGDASLRASMQTRFLTKLALPVSLVGSLVIAFAFTGGYRKTNNYGSAVLYGVVLGFVVYVMTEMAFRAGDAGLISPAIAAYGPPFIAIVAGVTVLLFREDGRTT